MSDTNLSCSLKFQGRDSDFITDYHLSKANTETVFILKIQQYMGKVKVDHLVQ